MRFNAFSRPLPPHPQMHLTRPRPSWTLINFSPLLLQGPMCQWTGGFGSSLPCVVCCFFKKSLLGVCWDPKEASGSWSDRLGGGQMMFNADAKRDSCGKRKSREDEGKQKFSRHDSHFGHTTFLALIAAATNCELLRVPPMRCPMSGYITILTGFVSWPVRV